MSGGSVRVQVTAAFDASGPSWRFTLTCPDAGPSEGWSIDHDVAAIRESPYYPKPRKPCESGCDHGLCEKATTDTLQDILERLDSGLTEGTKLGRYLFDTLLGTYWRDVIALGERLEREVIELALTWPYQDSPDQPDSSAAWTALSQLPWELMRDGKDRCLCAGQNLSIAVTRVVEGTTQGMPSSLPVPPRVLFVVGTPVTDPKVRAGAEMLAILREFRDRGYRIQHRILEEASPRKLREAMATFQPDIVHFISHGDVDPDSRGYITLRSDDDRPEPWSAKKLLMNLEVGRSLPPIVVLSACNTAGSMIVGPQRTAPLAAELVHGGIPVVVAMAGKISDRASRVFTRYFGRALADGESLVEATAHARKIAFAEAGPASHDWALPSIFFSAKVKPDKVRRADDPRARVGRKLIEDTPFEQVPVFCARDDILRVFWAMLGDEVSPTGWDIPGKRPSVLTVWLPYRRVGVGKTRLLYELARYALQSGHLPLVLGAEPTEQVPQNLDQLARELARAMKWLGTQVLRVRVEFGAELNASVKHDPIEADPPPEEKLARLVDALALDADQLREEAKAKYRELFEDDTRIIVLIDNLNDQCEELLENLFDRKWGLRGHGLGLSGAHPVPLVLVVIADAPSGIRHDIVKSRDAGWLVSRELKPFDSGGEDMLAYETVLLNPFRSGGNELTGRPWIFNRDIGTWENHVRYAQGFLEGSPHFFSNDLFDKFVTVGVDLQILAAADDNIPLEVLR